MSHAPSRTALIIGGGMITQDQLLPSLLQMKRKGQVEQVWVCGQRASTVRKLAKSPAIRRAFPEQSFRGFPESGDEVRPDLYREVLAMLPSGSVVLVAVPDDLHFEMTMAVLEAGHHAIVVKPLVMTVEQSRTIEALSKERGLFVGVEYHKRFDDRSLMARKRYQEGMFGEFKLGSAHLMEKWYYQRSNFQNWCTTDRSDAFVYIGCHYVDLVAFITGLLPARLSVHGIKQRYPNGNEGYLYTDARVIFNNGACLNVQNSLCVPDEMPGSNTQGLTMYFAGTDKGAFLKHSDQYRGLEYCYLERPSGEGSTTYAEPSPDYMQYVPLDESTLTPVGYGYRSVEALVMAAQGVAGQDTLEDRRRALTLLDTMILATPANSRYNEGVTEAARESILNDGKWVDVRW